MSVSVIAFHPSPIVILFSSLIQVVWLQNLFSFHRFLQNKISKQKNVAKAAALQALVLLDLFTTEKETQFVEKEHVEMLLWRSSALSVLLLLCNDDETTNEVFICCN